LADENRHRAGLIILCGKTSTISPTGKVRMFKGLDHFAIVVPDTEEALKIWRDRVGLKLLYSEVVNNGSVRLTHLDLGNTQLQLVEPLTPGHALKTWLASNGPGLHHICFKVDDVGKAHTELPLHNLPVAANIHQGTQGKRALFLDKSATQSVQVEITGA
jgi:methylmalonyl-CoA/ethylmalonyl-CoA epimerase